MEQAARDKARAEQEKTEYEVRTIDHCFIVIATLMLVPVRIRMLAVAMARMMRSRASVDVTIQRHTFLAKSASPRWHCPPWPWLKLLPVRSVFFFLNP